MPNFHNEIINFTNNNLLGVDDEEVITIAVEETSKPSVTNIKTPRALTIMKKDKIIYFDCCEIL